MTFLKVLLCLFAAQFAVANVHAQGSAANIATPTSTTLPFGFIQDFRAARLDNDSRTDIVLAGGSLRVFLQSSTGTFSSTPNYNLTSSSAVAVAVGDMDGDAIPDLVHLAFNHVMWVYLGGGATPYAMSIDTPMPTIQSTPADFCGLALGDINHDGLLDAVFNAKEIGVAIGDGTGGFSSSYAITGIINTNNPSQVVLIDMNGDGHLDIVSGEEGSPSPSALVFLGNGAGNFTAKPPVLTTGFQLIRGLAGADFDLDGDPDIVSATEYAGADVYTNNSLGVLGSPVNYDLSPANDEAHSVDVADLNEDGTSDVVIGALINSIGKVVEMVNDGKGLFVNTTTTVLTGSGNPTRVYVKTAQYDNSDSHPDIFFTSSGWQVPPPLPMIGYALNGLPPTTVNPWKDLGYSLTATTTPQLVGAGWVEAGYPWTLTLSNAIPGPTGAVWVFASMSENSPPPPFKGGSLVPDVSTGWFFIQLVGPPNANGAKVVAIAPQTGLPPATPFVFQFWCVDAAGIAGFSASNAVRVH